MAELGMDLIDVIVDLDALEKYCQERGLKNTSGTRTQYAAHLLSEQYPRQKQLQQRPPLKLRFKKKICRSATKRMVFEPPLRKFTAISPARD